MKRLSYTAFTLFLVVCIVGCVFGDERDAELNSLLLSIRKRTQALIEESIAKREETLDSVKTNAAERRLLRRNWLTDVNPLDITSPAADIPCIQLQVGKYVVLQQRPCKLTDVVVTFSGKHGDAKVNLQGTDIFTGTVFDHVCPAPETIHMPEVVKMRMRVSYIVPASGDELARCLLEDYHDITSKLLPIPETSVGRQIQEGYDATPSYSNFWVTVVSSMGEDMMSLKSLESA